MALDVGGTLEAKIWDLLLANPNLAAGCKVGNRIDYRAAAVAAARKRLHRLPADYLEIEVGQTGGTQRKTTTPTFGLAQSIPQADGVIPVSATFELRLAWDPGQWEKNFPGSPGPDVEAQAAINAAGVKLGIPWVNSVEWRDKITTPPDKGSKGKFSVVRTLTIEGRPRLSQMR